MGVPTYNAWEDMRFALSRVRQGATAKPDFDTTNIGLLFPQNDPLEIAYINDQTPHGHKVGSALRPHLHWRQQQATLPVWKIDYRLLENGGDSETAFTTLTSNGTVFTYTSGNIIQISTFPEIDTSAFSGLSILFDIKLYRDDNLVAGDVLGKTFDLHVLYDTPGSRQEYTK